MDLPRTRYAFWRDLRNRQHLQPRGETHICTTLHPAASLLLSLRPGKTEQAVVEQAEVIECGVLPAAESYALDEPNVLLLDQARWSWNDGPLEAREGNAAS